MEVYYWEVSPLVVGIFLQLWALVGGWAGLGPERQYVLDMMQLCISHTFGISRSPATLLLLAPMLDLILLMSTLLPPFEGNSF